MRGPSSTLIYRLTMTTNVVATNSAALLWKLSTLLWKLLGLLVRLLHKSVSQVQILFSHVLVLFTDSADQPQLRIR